MLKGEKFSLGIAASDVEVEEFFGHALYIDPSLDKNHLTKEALKDAPALQKFMDKHCNASHYVFQVRKCLDASCYFCQDHPIRMPIEDFKTLAYLPLPLLDSAKEHYRPFDELFGQNPSDQDRPSKGPPKDDQSAVIDRENSLLFRNTRVRGCMVCQECLKPRCIYAASVLSDGHKAAVRIVEDSRLYSCGSPLFGSDSPISTTVVIRQKLSCSSPMESTYYSATLVSLPPVCYWCGVCKDALVYDEEYTIQNFNDSTKLLDLYVFYVRVKGKVPLFLIPTTWLSEEGYIDFCVVCMCSYLFCMPTTVCTLGLYLPL